MNRVLLLIGNFPPPINGLSTATQTLYDRLQAVQIPLVKVNTSPPTSQRGLYRLQRLPRVLVAWSRLVRFGSKQVLYIPLSGGWGQIYDIVTIILARFLRMQPIFHHHSTAYLVRKSWVTETLFTIAGKDAVHIVLCDAMRTALWEKYKCPKIILFSNRALFPMEEAHGARNQMQAIGFLSNLTTEKGGWEVIELARVIGERQWPLKIIVAGPCLEPDLVQALQQSDQEGILQWRGAVYGEDKRRFFEDVDVFVFPTQYRNEAEPLVIWEALATGLPVIAYDRGCIQWQVGLAGTIVPKENDFVMDALEVLKEWMIDPAKYRNASAMAYKQYQSLYSSAMTQWATLLEVLQQLGV